MIDIDPQIFPKMAGAYLVGGSIRDMLYGRSPADFDIAVIGDPFIFAKRFGSHINGRLVEIGKPGRMIVRVVSDRTVIDISPAKEASIEKDLMARDFTINAMAYDLSSERLIDPLGAQRDLANRTIRMVTADIFKQDPVRLLRAYRIAAQFGFEIEAKTQTTIKENASLISQTAGERIRDELLKLLGSDRSHHYICQMAACSLLFAFLPELADLKNCRQNRHHQFNVLEHSLQAYDHLEKLLVPASESTAGEDAQQLAQYVSRPNIALLKFSTLVHDIGKPATQTTDRGRGLHFYGHERSGARLAENICRRLRCSNHFTDSVHFLVAHHGRPRNLYTALQEQNAAPRAVTRFYMKCAAYLPEVLVMSAADKLAKATDQSRETEDYLNFLVKLMHDFESDFKPRSSEPPLISGHDLITEFGLKPSALFKQILNRVEEERLSKSDMERQEAIGLVRQLIQDPKLNENG